jgi:hypothetical protein
MAKRTNRIAWGLAVVLALLVLGGSGRLFVRYQNRMPEQERWVTLLPQDQWGFGQDQAANLRAIAAALRLYPDEGGGWWPRRWRLGFLSVRVEWRPPPLAPGASTRRGTAR